MLKPGIYEQLINLAIQEELSAFSEEEKNIVKIDEAEASTVLAQYCSDIIRSNLEQLSDQDTTAKIQVINKIIALLSSEGEDISQLSVGPEGEPPNLAYAKQVCAIVRWSRRGTAPCRTFRYPLRKSASKTWYEKRKGSTSSGKSDFPKQSFYRLTK